LIGLGDRGASNSLSFTATRRRGPQAPGPVTGAAGRARGCGIPWAMGVRRSIEYKHRRPVRTERGGGSGGGGNGLLCFAPEINFVFRCARCASFLFFEVFEISFYFSGNVFDRANQHLE